MAAHQKIHPADLETGSQEAPLVSRDSVHSEKGDAASPATRPPLYPRRRRAIPVAHSEPPKKRRSRCCRCLCWTFCMLLLFIVLVAATAGILYLVFQPKAPKYSVDRLRISSFNVNNSASGSFDVSAAFSVVVTATNPNKKIGIFYEEKSHLSVWYDGTNLCTGSLPAFYQGHRNTTVLTVALTGQTAVDTNMIRSLEAQRQAGTIPLLFRGSVPVRVKFGALKLWKVRFLVSCDIVVNNLSVANNISIRSSRCGFKFRM
ncbi:unnamed protein product [Spirodela intermedia]|uniref:Late embryogenesis abundant protein LEA-2 subgroup domain-containing protein n=1 Tax=Spirodela intermedia TaxID=51605 RepID=A0A7I8JT86_SPIIN|nr:unnamed protein product [Spirodela intermedia]CAA6673390.1 unnamed protein product [Spirodela intermedia]